MKRRPAWIVPAIVALVALLPFARGLLAGESLYFRDLTLYFYPARLFALEGLRLGEIRFWNPYVHEGEPLYPPPIGYPLDLIQVLAPSDAGLSSSLVLHVSFGAVAFFMLGRGLGLGQLAAAGGALAYALGGFNLSTLNLYRDVQATAWAPLVVLGLQRTVRDGRALGPAALAWAVAVSTTGAEIAIQAFVLGVVVAAPGRDARAWLRVFGIGAIGSAIAAPVIVVMAGLVSTGVRGVGFPTAVVLSHSIHPLAFLQIVVAGLFGDPGNPVNHWWGSNFFTRGFPYYLSLYLGACVLSVACVGIREGETLARRLSLLALGAGLLCLGRWAHLEALVDVLPMRPFRYPSKAFFTVHASAALLATLGLEALVRGTPRAWRWLLVTALPAGLLLAALPFAPSMLPGTVRWFVAGFFPPEFAWTGRLDALGRLLADAEKGGLVAIVSALIAAAVLQGRIRASAAAGLIAALATADLLRGNAGLNRTVDPGLLHPSPEIVTLAQAIREQGGRIYSPDPGESPALTEGRRAHPWNHEQWSFAVLADTATPSLNMRLALPSALSIDLTMLGARDRVTPHERAGPGGVPDLLPSLRNAGVAHLLSLDPLADPALELRSVLAPPRIAPLRLLVYALEDPLPLRSIASEVAVATSQDEARRLSERPGFQDRGGVVLEAPARPVVAAQGRILALRERPGRIEAEVDADRPTLLFLRDAWVPGWSAVVAGQPAPVLRGNGRHSAVPIPGGRSLVTLRYAPPGIRLAACVSVAAAVLLGLLWRSRG